MSRHWKTVVVLVGFAAAGCDSTTSPPPGNATKKQTTDDSSSSKSSDAESAPKPQLTRGGKEPAKNDLLLNYYGDDPDTLNLITSNDNVSTAFQRLVYEYL